jgi:hypothetical protein
VFVLALPFAAFFYSARGHRVSFLSRTGRTPRRIAVGLLTQAGTGNAPMKAAGIRAVSRPCIYPAPWPVMPAPRPSLTSWSTIAAFAEIAGFVHCLKRQ